MHRVHHGAVRRRVLIEFGLAAALIALIFGAALILPLPFWHAAPPAPPSPPGGAGAGASPDAGLGWPAALLALGFALALTVPYRPYLQALQLASRVPTRLLIALTAGLALIGLLIYPAFGSDLFVYLDYERLWAVYGANPLLAAPNLHPEDWAFGFTWIPQQPSPYGPLWPLLTWPIARLAGDSLWGWIVGYKLLALVCYVTCCALIWAISSEPTARKRALLVFAWSPLVLFEVLAKAHNDGVLAVSALASVWLLRTHKPALGLLAASTGALIKLSGLAVVLAVSIVLARQRAWRALILGIIAAALLAIALYAPFWVGPQSLAPVLVQTSRVVWSPGALLIGLFNASGPSIDLAARVLSAALFAAVCLIIARRGPEIASGAGLLLIGTLLLLTTAFFAHYLVPVVALAAVSGNWRLERISVALSIGALAAYSVELLALALGPGWIGSPGYQVFGSALTLGPAVALLGTWAIRDLPRIARAPAW